MLENYLVVNGPGSKAAVFEDTSQCLFEKNNQKGSKRDAFPEWIEDLCHGKVAEVFLPERELDLEQVSIN